MCGRSEAPGWRTTTMLDTALAAAEGLAAVKLGDIVQQVQDAMWQPEYRRIRAA